MSIWHISYLSERQPPLLIYILHGYLAWKNIKYYWVLICKIYKQVIKYSFVQAGMVVINQVVVDSHLCVYLLQTSCTGEIIFCPPHNLQRCLTSCNLRGQNSALIEFQSFENSHTCYTKSECEMIFWTTLPFLLCPVLLPSLQECIFNVHFHPWHRSPPLFRKKNIWQDS